MTAALAQEQPPAVIIGSPATGQQPASGTGTGTSATPAPSTPSYKYDVYIDTTKGSTQTWIGPPGGNPPSGAKWEKIATGATLSQNHIDFLSTHGADKQPAIVADNKVSFQYYGKGNGFARELGADGKVKTYLYGDDKIYDWTGPDKFSYDAETGTTYFEGKPIGTKPDASGSYPFLDPTTKKPLDYGLNILKGGGYVEETPDGLMFKDSGGKTVNTFTNEEWSAWKPYFQKLDNSQHLATAYTIKDLGIDADDVKGSTATGFYGDDFAVTQSGNQIRVQSGGTYNPSTGTMSGDYTDTTYTIGSDGKKNPSQIIRYEDAGTANEKKTTYAYSDTQIRVNGEVVATKVTYAGVQGTFWKLGNVAGVDVVRDADGNTKYFKGGKELTDAEEDKFEDANEKALDDLEKNKGDKLEEAEGQRKLSQLTYEQTSQFGSLEIFLSTFVQYYRQFSGLAGYSSLIFDEEFLADWRNTVNTIMCDKLHLPTKDCWTSKICAKYTDIKPTRNGILYTAPVGGAPRAIAHVEGVRSAPITLPNQTSWIYTVTFGLTNPTDKTMSYNVRFSGPNRAVTWWPEAQTIDKGGTAAALGAESLIKMSVHDYSQVCLEFNPSITAFGGKKLGSICNGIVQQSPTATAPYPVATANATSNATAPGASAPGQTAPGEQV
jgi:hypothetical protein